MIDWGDESTPTAGTVKQGPFFMPLSGSTSTSSSTTTSTTPSVIVVGQPSPTPPIWLDAPYVVFGQHNYAAPGQYTITVTITSTLGASASATSTATVTSPTSQGQAQGISFTATTNQPDYNQDVAVFPAADPSDLPDDYTATIDWGDATTTAGIVFAAPALQVPSSASVPLQPIFTDQFAVNGYHTYTMAGTYTVTVTITDLNGNTQTATSTATVTNATVTNTTGQGQAQGLSFTATTNQPDDNQNVAVFPAKDVNDFPENYTATIDWGDGTTMPGPSLPRRDCRRFPVPTA